MSHVPGFTAQASFHGASERYAGVATAPTSVQNRAVIPQICFTVPLCLPVLHKKIRVCCGLFSGCSYSLVNC